MSYPNYFIYPTVAAATGLLMFGCLKMFTWSKVKKCETKQNQRSGKVSKDEQGTRTPKVVIPKWATKRDLQSPEMTPAKLNERRPPEMWNTVLTFPDASGSSMEKLKYFLMEAKVSILVCVYVCSNFEISDVLESKYKEGLLVEILTEFDTWTAHNSNGFKTLRATGMEIRLHARGTNMMHNKFVIIDDEVLLTGSLNWTNQGVQTNHENIVVTTDQRIVSKYLEEYYDIKRKTEPYYYLT